MLRRRRLQLVAGLVLAVVAAAVFRAGSTAPIDSYAACVEAGNPILESSPPLCLDHGRSFTGTPAPEPPAAPPVASVEFETLVDGDTHSQLPARGTAFVSTQAEWEGYWRTAHAGLPALPPLIPMDFAQSSVVALSLGSQPTAGYGLKITSITTGPHGATINAVESIPTVTCAVAAVVTNRYLIVRTPKLTGPATFKLVSQKRGCD